MIELMEVYEEDDDDNNSELDKSNGSSGSKNSGISTHSGGSTSNKRTPEAAQRKVLNTTNVIPIASTNTPVSHKSQVFIPPNLQKVNLKAVGHIKKEPPVKRKGDLIPSVSGAVVKKLATIVSKQPKPHNPIQHTKYIKSPVQSQIQQVSGSSEGSSGTRVDNPEISVPEQSTIKVESTTTQIKTEPVTNGYPDTFEDQSNDESELRLPANFFKHLCSSNRHEAFGLYLANFMNRLDTSSAKKLELKLLQTITEFQAEHDN